MPYWGLWTVRAVFCAPAREVDGGILGRNRGDFMCIGDWNLEQEESPLAEQLARGRLRAADECAGDRLGPTSKGGRRIDFGILFEFNATNAVIRDCATAAAFAATSGCSLFSVAALSPGVFGATPATLSMFSSTSSAKFALGLPLGAVHSLVLISALWAFSRSAVGVSDHFPDNLQNCLLC